VFEFKAFCQKYQLQESRSVMRRNKGDYPLPGLSVFKPNVTYTWFIFIFVIKLMLLPLFRLETISRKQLFNSRIFSFTIYIKIETWQIYPDPRYLTLRFNTHQVKSLKFEGNKH